MWQAHFPDNRLLLLEEAAKDAHAERKVGEQARERNAVAATGGLRCGRGDAEAGAI